MDSVREGEGGKIWENALLLGLPGSRGNEAGLLGEGDRNTAMAKRPCIDTEAG